MLRRTLAAHSHLCAAVSDCSGMTAALLRLLGLAALQHQQPALASTVQAAAGTLCDFESPCPAETLAAMTTIAGKCGESVRNEVTEALMKMVGLSSERDKGSFETDAALTLVEAAAQHSNPTPMKSPCRIFYVTGPCSWLPQVGWIFLAVKAVMRRASAIFARDPDNESVGSVRRKAVAAALLR